VDIAYGPQISNRKDIFTTRLVRRRQSTSSFELSGSTSKGAADAAFGEHGGWAAPRSLRNYRSGFPIVYQIQCDAPGNKSRHHNAFLYEDDPCDSELIIGQQSTHLSGTKPVYHLQEYVRRFQQLSFVIVKARQCGVNSGLYLSQTGRDETMLILNEDLQQAIQRVTTCPLEEFSKNKSLEFRAPYQLLYFHKDLLQKYSQSVNILLQKEIEAVIRYIVTYYGDEYVEAEKLVSQGKITVRHLDKIFRPNQLIVHSFASIGDREPKMRAVEVVSKWPKIIGSMLVISVWGWRFTEVRCSRSYENYEIHAPVEDETEEFLLESFGMYPLSILDKQSVDYLCQRGKKSWGLRRPSFVYCTGTHFVKAGRYIIDNKMHDDLHPTLMVNIQPKTRNKQTDPWRLRLDNKAELTEEEFLMMPTTIPGYDVLEKEWVRLPVPNIEPVHWKKLPFENLVLPDETKRLVRAMVTVRASSIKTKRDQRMQTSFDIIPGKGNGLIMLFHGSPGTGKTLTAESVAEIAEMPLYPITCGDIGTEPDKVEDYLRLAFKLGKRWNCVLLLDEADVFLEERSLTDLQRNSLVSVFLRVLEYYEGILILTSNRVGTFDEAFRSRIHIALHYEDLKPRSRRQIWSNFLVRLEGTEDGENVNDIKYRLDELANHSLNGREIRNALSTARQLASYEGKKMGWEHLELAIKTANTFGTYLRDVHGHSNSNWVQEKRVR
jgi:hypothetical protein